MLGLPKLAEEPEEPMYSGTHPMLSAVVRGTAVHRLIELLSRQPDQASSWRDLAKRVWEEQRIPLAARDQATQEIEALIRHFLNSRIYREFNRKNSPLTEVEFVMDTGEMRIQGVIDALIRQPDGSLELIDYKTDHVTAEKAGEAAEEYVPQLQMYSRAVKEKWGVFPKRATLYFLKPNVEICFPVTGEWIESTECAIRSTVRLLQMGTADYPWPTNPGKRCRDCDFAWICENAHSIS
jgi:ATP-dependent helicase/nuclease subunit A